MPREMPKRFGIAVALTPNDVRQLNVSSQSLADGLRKSIVGIRFSTVLTVRICQVLDVSPYKPESFRYSRGSEWRQSLRPPRSITVAAVENRVEGDIARDEVFCEVRRRLQ